MDIRLDELTSADVIQLLQEHLDEMASHSPAESMHALDLEGLKMPNVSFWVIREEGELLGCGALSQISKDHAEIKSMRTAYAHRGKGVGKAMLLFILEQANNRGITQLSLETGSMEGFLPARQLYEAYGFEYCEPFEDYIEDPHSVFMTRRL